MRIFKFIAAAVGLILVAGLVAPYVSAAAYGNRLRASLERALGRRVEIQGPVRFSLFKGPGISAENVVIHEDPALGFEPIAYVDKIEVGPAFWSLIRGQFGIGSIRLEDATINLTKSPAGSWNFASFVNRSVMSTAPAIHVRHGRINFNFGVTQSVFYLMETDLDISPPASLTGGWKVSGEALAARTDRPAQEGLGSFTLNGRWWVAPERVDLDVRLERTQLGELAVLMSGQAGGVHGTITSRLHLAGPINGIGILGRLTVEDVHRWDLLPSKGQGWPLDLRGRLDLTGQQLELQATSAVVPITTRFRASDYLSNPRWAVTMTWNRFPIGPVVQLATDMGASFPPKLGLTGTIDGAIGYSGPGGFEGQLVLHDSAVTIPDSPPVRFDEVHVMVDHGKIWLAPALVHTAEHDEARLEATYSMDDGTLDLSIGTGGMNLESLRAQAALAAVPWLEHMNSGQWSGELRYHVRPENGGWTGDLRLMDAQVAVPGLADPLQIESAHVAIDGSRVNVDRLSAQVGKIAFTGEYRYDPDVARPHRLRVQAPHVNATDLETELMPTLRRSTSLIARAFGRSTVPAWLRERKLDGSVQIGELDIADTRLENVRARLTWDVASVGLTALEAKIGRAAITGTLAVELAGLRPTYLLSGKVKALDWQSGKLDAEGTLETAGTGEQLLANLKSDGTFSSSGMDFGALAGDYSLAWAQNAPRLRLNDLSLRTEDATYIGSGATQNDGRLLISLTSGSREMRMSGTVAALKVDEAGAGPAPRTTP
ncbi:MAG TPA: hypothetical protein VG096_08230 [Bryobacteraceae bacterium]|jgi:hypothetical protein|nr:hypothetical protein [Bryobacteraceae bacterium]